MAQTEITLAFGDGEYLFRLGLAQINELQAKCGIGIGGLYARLLKGRYIMQSGQQVGAAGEAEFFIADIIETLRQGLIGGGKGLVDGQAVQVTPLVANRLVQSYGPPARPVVEGWTVAAAVLGALIEGYTPPKDPPAPAGQAEKAKQTKTAKAG